MFGGDGAFGELAGARLFPERGGMVERLANPYAEVAGGLADDADRLARLALQLVSRVVVVVWDVIVRQRKCLAPLDAMAVLVRLAVRVRRAPRGIVG